VRSREARKVFSRLALGSLVVLVGLGLALGVVDALAVPRRIAARVPAPTPTPRN
jgi:hypothetical protein